MNGLGRRPKTQSHPGWTGGVRAPNSLKTDKGHAEYTLRRDLCRVRAPS
jgi:hypothetical protein